MSSILMKYGVADLQDKEEEGQEDLLTLDDLDRALTEAAKLRFKYHVLIPVVEDGVRLRIKSSVFETEEDLIEYLERDTTPKDLYVFMGEQVFFKKRVELLPGEDS